MPTKATQPSLRTTQAVAAVLWQQFARDRLTQSGIKLDSLPLVPEEAGDQLEELDFLSASFLQDEEDIAKENCQTTISNDNNDSTSASFNNTTSFASFPNESVYHSMTTNQITSDLSTNATNNSETFTLIDDITSNTQSIDDSITPSVASTTLNLSNGHNQIDSTRQDTLKKLNKRLQDLEENPLLAKYGRELRDIAEEFEKDRLRKVVKCKAEEVNFDHLTKEAFFKLLEELFLYGVTREKIVILFFFCTDVALKAYSAAPTLVSSLLTWSLSYIMSRVSAWVQEHGGWDVVLCRYVLPQIYMGAGLLLIIALSLYIRKSLVSV